MPRVLVIDDDESVRGAIEALLRPENCDVVLAENARRGAELFGTSPFDVVMVDIFMPGMNGLETIKDFRRADPEMPIIAMSGFRFRSAGMPMPDFLKIASELGATYCLSKPFRPQQLFEAIDVCVRLPAQRRRAVSVRT
ncbi:LuxR family transcriptional regulator [Terrihabitans soli]|uniref:LuxR family transcriptional regulator n=1 Tax=Terrihabitans soli TaxID=708113 RepID=A0A6S6QZ44_9HYPH|nr:response regulator [Terrihabitans soli]BCJ92360.1 LuxR family transcriptional regulator [Terrihabitans soli]